MRLNMIETGPQSVSDNSFTKKARMLQSIWRTENNLPIGIGPNKDSQNRDGKPSYYGNMINKGETNGHNFFFTETFEYAKWRVNTKLRDETIDTYRLFNNLLSSMPLAFNLFHPLMMLKEENPSAVDLIVKEAFPFIPSIFRVLEIGLEFVPTPIEKYTHDKSAMDAFIRFQDREGSNYLIAIEVKYTDSLGSNTVSNKIWEHSLKVIEELDLFTPESILKIHKGKLKVSQIFRNVILAEKYGKVHGYEKVYSIILAPEGNTSTGKEIDLLKSHLNIGAKSRVHALILEHFTGSLREYCTGKYLDWINWFHNRYLDFSRVDEWE